MSDNKYLKNLNRIEVVVTDACTGRCRHCSQGEHAGECQGLDKDLAVSALRTLAGLYNIGSLMTFGGEPLLYPQTVVALHSAATELGIPKRQLITNGFFGNGQKTAAVAKELSLCGVNDVLLSVDAFHQEHIPVAPVLGFAAELIKWGVPLRTQPAWLVSDRDNNPYNVETRRLLSLFAELGISAGEGNVVFPEGNALKYLGEYFTEGAMPENPYREDPTDLRSVSIEPDGTLLGGNLHRQSVKEIITAYKP